MTLWRSPLRNLTTAAVVAGAVAVLVFLNALDNGFAFDDLLIIVDNTEIQDLATLPDALVKPYWPGIYGKGLGLWRPLTTGFFGLQWALFDGLPVGFHLVNVLLHAGVTVLVVLVVGELLPVAGAFLAGLLFAVHPVHVEAVANVVGTAEVLAAFFFLWASVLILRGEEQMGPGRLVSVLILYALAFLTKESAITLPGVVLLLDCSKRDCRLRDLGTYLARRWPLYGGMMLVAVGVLLGRYLVLGSLANPYPPLGARILTEIPRIWTVAVTWTHILRLLFFPMDLSADYSPAVVPIALGWNAANLLGVAMVLGLLGLALGSWRQGPAGRNRLSPRVLGWGVVWFVITFSPTSNLLFLSGILLAERILYLPSVGFVAAAAWGILRLWEVRSRVAILVVLAAVALGAVKTWTRTPTWKNNLEVFHTLTSEHPEAGRSQWILGDTYFGAGQISEGLKAYRNAAGLVGDSYNFLVSVARTLMTRELYRPAEVLLVRAWEQRPEYDIAPGLLALNYHVQERYQESVEAARYSIARDSTDAFQYHILARSLRALGRYEEAVWAREGAILAGEGDRVEQWIWLAELRFELQDTTGARSALDSARLRIDSVTESQRLDSILSAMGMQDRGKRSP